MSRALLAALRDHGAFDPAPRHSELHDVHVPFDELLCSRSCETALLAGLHRGDRLALVGSSGAGKSSIIAGTLGPLVEGIFPVSIPVAVERSDVARDASEFVRHLVRTVSRMLAEQLPALGRQIRRLQAGTEQAPDRVSRMYANLPLPAGLRPALGYELQRVVREPAPTSAQVLDQGRELLGLIADDGLTPILVLDDTDRWLTTLRTDSESVRREFFSTIPRLLAEDLAVAAVVAVHPTYLRDRAYREARGFLSGTITVPRVPDSAGLAKILARRCEIALFRTQFATVDTADVPAILTPAALVRLFEHYAAGAGDLRRDMLLVAHLALTLALDDGAEAIEAAHIDLAITS